MRPRAGVREERRHCLQKLSLETGSPRVVLAVSLHPAHCCPWVAEIPLFPVSPYLVPLPWAGFWFSPTRALARKGSFLFHFFFRPENAQMNIRMSECFRTSILNDGQSLLAGGEMGAAAETGDLVEAAEEARGFLSLGQKSRQHHSPRGSGSQHPSLRHLRP